MLDVCSYVFFCELLATPQIYLAHDRINGATFVRSHLSEATTRCFRFDIDSGMLRIGYEYAQFFRFEDHLQYFSPFFLSSTFPQKPTHLSRFHLEISAWCELKGETGADSREGAPFGLILRATNYD